MNYDVILNANESAILETQYSFTQGDYGQIQFSVRVKADGQYVTDAMRAYIVFTLPNGMIVTGADMPKTVATYTYVFQGNELQAPGKVVADVKLVYTSGQVSSNKFTFICRYDPLADKSVPAGTYITELQKIVDEGQEKLDYLQALIDALEQGIGETPLTRADLQNNRDVTSPGVKALDAAMAQFLLLKGDMTNQIVNDNNKVASASSVHSLQQTTNASIANLNSNLGAVKKEANTTVSIPSGAGGTTVNSISLTEGTYILIQRTSFPMSSVGRRRQLFETNDSNVNLFDNGIVTATGVADEVTALSSSTVAQITGSGSVYSNLVQTSGGDMNGIVNVLIAIKLK